MDIIAIFPSTLNEASKSRLGRNSDGSTKPLLQFMTGIKPRTVILQALSAVENTTVAHTIQVLSAVENTTVAHTIGCMIEKNACRINAI